MLALLRLQMKSDVGFREDKRKISPKSHRDRKRSLLCQGLQPDTPDNQEDGPCQIADTDKLAESTTLASRDVREVHADCATL